MKAVHAVYLLASLMAISSAVECPFGQRVNGKFPNGTKTCPDSCVEFKCDVLQEVQYGCPEDAFQECPAFQVKVSDDPDATAFCSKDLNGNVSYYYPGCQDQFTYEACSNTNKLAGGFSFLMKACKELVPGGEYVNSTAELIAEVPAGRAICTFGHDTKTLTYDPVREVQCTTCVEYQCHGMKKVACAENAIKDCPELEYWIEDDVTDSAYCKKESDGTFLSYLPLCICGKLQDCMKDKKVLTEHSELHGRCEELDPEEEIYKAVYDETSIRTTICPRVFNQSWSYNVFCEACVTYEFWSFKEQSKVSRRGCITDYEVESFNMQEQRLKIARYQPGRMAYTDDNVLYWSGCMNEVEWDNCAAHGTGMTYESDMHVCHGKVPGQLLWSPKFRKP